MNTPPDHVNPSDLPRSFIELPSGTRAAYTEEGQGLPLVAVHGAPGSGRDFRWLAPRLSQAMRVIRIDLPGYGETPGFDGAHLVERRTDFVLEVMEALQLPPALILGHSQGGAVATAVAQRAPDRVLGLVLLASVGARRHRAQRFPLAGVWKALLARPYLEPLLGPLARRAFVAAGFPRGTPTKEVLLTFRTALNISFVDHAARLRVLEVPTCVAWCEDDRFIEPEIFEELERMCPEGPRMRFAKGGHNLQKSHAAEIAECLLSWAEQRSWNPSMI